MRNRAAIHLTSLFVSIMPVTLVGQEVVKHDTEQVSVTLPKGWKRNASHSKMTPLGKGQKVYEIMTFGASPPESGREVYFDVNVVNGGAFHMRPYVLTERVYWQSYQGVEKTELNEKPLLYLVAHQVKPTRVVLAAAYRRATGRTVRLEVRCRASQWELVRPAFLEMAQGMTFDLSPWPSRPAGRTEKLSNGILFSADPEIKKPSLRELQKCALEVQKGLVGIHGAIRRPKRDPLVIYLNELMADHKRIAAAQDVQPVVAELAYHRLFTIPLGKRGSDQRDKFVADLCSSMLYEIYGSVDSMWFDVGERSIAMCRDATKKRLPSMPKYLADKIQITMKFDEVARLKRPIPDDELRQCLAYVAMFHAGPKEYRAVYRVFLADVNATGDIGAATKRHLLSLDMDKLQTEVRLFVKRLRGVKVK